MRDKLLGIRIGMGVGALKGLIDGGPSQVHRAECQRYLQQIQLNFWWLYDVRTSASKNKKEKGNIKYSYQHTWFSATLVLVCWLALSLCSVWSTRTYCCMYLLLCAGQIACSPAVLAVCSYCGYRSSVCAFTRCAQKKQVQTREEKGK